MRLSTLIIKKCNYEILVHTKKDLKIHTGDSIMQEIRVMLCKNSIKKLLFWKKVISLIMDNVFQKCLPLKCFNIMLKSSTEIAQGCGLFGMRTPFNYSCIVNEDLAI